MGGGGGGGGWATNTLSREWEMTPPGGVLVAAGGHGPVVLLGPRLGRSGTGTKASRWVAPVTDFRAPASVQKKKKAKN